MSQTTLQPRAPDELKRTLTWFGSIIERPIDLQSCMMPIAPSGRPMEDEAPDYIIPSPTLQPHQRIELYNQQYWWRLLNILHENFPTLTRLFGYQAFYEIIGTPYICRYRPDDWSLARLGHLLPRFLQYTYNTEDRELVIASATLDFAYIDSFLAKQRQPLNLPKDGTLEQLLDTKLFLQPHAKLFDFPFHLFSFREALIQEKNGDHWLEHPLPPLDTSKRFHFVLYRNHFNHILWKEISPAEHLFLQFFEKGYSISDACDRLAEHDNPIVEQALSHIHLWLQEWTLYGLLTTEKT